MVGTIAFKNAEMKDAFIKKFNSISDKGKNGMTIRESTLDDTKIYFNWLTN